MIGTILPPVLVLAADRDLGRGVVAAAVAVRQPVIAAGADARRLDALRQLHPDADLALVTGDCADDAAAAALADAVRALDRPLAAVIASLPPPPLRGRLLDQPVDALRTALDTTLLAHAAAARHLLPLLKRCDRGGAYVMVGGPGGRAPWAGYGHRSIAAASLRMLAQVLHNEAATLSLRLQLLSVEDAFDGGVDADSRVRTHRDGTPADHDTPDPDAASIARVIGRKALSLALCERCTEATHAVVDYRAQVAACATTPSAHRALDDARSLLRRVASLAKCPPHHKDPSP